MPVEKGFDENNINIQEGHLGGYIKSSERPTPSGLDVRNGDPLTWHPSLWLWMMSALNVRSLLDIGCGEGHSAAFFKRYGCRVLGVDGSELAQRDSKIPAQHIRHDFADGAFASDTPFDAVWCSEFVEHVEEQFVDNFLTSFQCAKRYVFMTYAEPGQTGWHHVNCQRQPYWEEKLAGIGFSLDQQLTQFARAISEFGHFSQKGLVFRKLSQNFSAQAREINSTHP